MRSNHVAQDLSIWGSAAKQTMKEKRKIVLESPPPKKKKKKSAEVLSQFREPGKVAELDSREVICKAR